MQWIASAEKDAGNAALEKCLGNVADTFCANSGLKNKGREGGVPFARGVGAVRSRAAAQGPLDRY